LQNSQGLEVGGKESELISLLLKKKEMLTSFEVQEGRVEVSMRGA
jgi:hypothetical protein